MAEKRSFSGVSRHLITVNARAAYVHRPNNVAAGRTHQRALLRLID